MPFKGQSLVDASTLHRDEVFSIFEAAEKFRLGAESKKHKGRVALLFFEPSTRTRASFETAAQILGLNVISLDPSKSSVTKGESIEDTLFNIEAMGVDLFVIRHQFSGLPQRLMGILKTPLINAGDGTHQHPTQALLDAYTIWRHKPNLKGCRVLIVGDVLHSRVARSNMDLLPRLGAQVAVCGPSTLVPDLIKLRGFQIFRDLKEALGWADVVMLLRMQMERQDQFQVPSLKEYSMRFGITTERLAWMKSDSLLLHPGPVNQGVEITPEAMTDSRSGILEQVRNGVFIRAALMDAILGGQS